MLGLDFNSRGMETCRGSIPPRWRCSSRHPSLVTTFMRAGRFRPGRYSPHDTVTCSAPWRETSGSQPSMGQDSLASRMSSRRIAGAARATETLVARACTSIIFHFSGSAPPSDLVGESGLGLGAMILGIGHVGLSPSRLAFCARAMIIRIFVLGDFWGEPKNR